MRDVPIACPMAMSTLRCLFSLKPPSFMNNSLPTLKTFHFICFIEICGVGEASWRIHDMETSGVSVWGGSGHPTLPPHCSHLQWGWWEHFCTIYGLKIATGSLLHRMKYLQIFILLRYFRDIPRLIFMFLISIYHMTGKTSHQYLCMLSKRQAIVATCHKVWDKMTYISFYVFFYLNSSDLH